MQDLPPCQPSEVSCFIRKATLPGGAAANLKFYLSPTIYCTNLFVSSNRIEIASADRLRREAQEEQDPNPEKRAMAKHVTARSFDHRR
jgi:hypothetical protein